MTSKSFAQGVFLNRGDAVAEGTFKSEQSSKYRHPTVYDATAGEKSSSWTQFFLSNTSSGRISIGGFINNTPFIASSRDTASSSSTALPPESFLFRSKHAPTRYAESDIYFVNQRKDLRDLPESDLLKALHSYSSDFYSRATVDGGEGDYQSLDETALIALGILLEEASLDNLGKTGDLAFTEGEMSESIPQVSSEKKPKSDNRPSKKRRVG